jgi:hypothetical protein
VVAVRGAKVLVPDSLVIVMAELPSVIATICFG